MADIKTGDIVLNSEQQKAADAIKARQHVWIYGSGSTGKSFLLNKAIFNDDKLKDINVIFNEHTLDENDQIVDKMNAIVDKVEIPIIVILQHNFDNDNKLNNMVEKLIKYNTDGRNANPVDMPKSQMVGVSLNTLPNYVDPKIFQIFHLIDKY